MNLQTFFQKFELFADAPDAIVRMRELVLELAVQGKIVEQDSRDEPAAELLQRLIKFKLENPLSGRSGRSKEDLTAKDGNNENLPANWVSTTIGEVLYVIRGASPRPKGDPQYFSEARTPYHWVKISDIRKHGQNGLLMDTDEFLTKAGMLKSVLLPKGTLVLTNSATIGIPIVLGIEGCCIHDGYLAFPNFPHDLLSQKFLLYLFHTLKKHAERNARGLAQLNLNTDLVRSFPFGLPPLAEQKRIVAKVDELMGLCDRLEAQQEERETKHAALARASLARFADAPTPANLNVLFHSSYTIQPSDLRKSILTLAVQGKLVPQDPNDEPAEKFLNRTKARHVQSSNGSKSRKEKTTVAISDDEIPFAIPESWVWCRLETIADTVTDGEHLSPVKTASGMPLLTATHVTARGVTLNNTQYVSVEDGHKSRQRCDPTRGDILICSRGTIGRCAVVETDEVFCLMGSVILVRFPAGSAPRYFNCFLSTDLAQTEMRGMSGATAVQALYLKDIRQALVPIPPLAEQRRIVARVDELMALVDRLETMQTDSRAAAAQLLEAVVAELTAA